MWVDKKEKFIKILFHWRHSPHLTDRYKQAHASDKMWPPPKQTKKKKKREKNKINENIIII